MELIAVILVLLAVLFGEIRLYQKNGLSGLSYRCLFSENEVTEGESVQFTEELVNDKSLPVPWLKAELTVPRWLNYPDSHSAVTGDFRFVTGFFSLRSHAKVSRFWQVFCEKRGIYSVSHVVLVTSDLLGIVRLSLAAEDTGKTVTVLPRRFTAAGLLLPKLFQQRMGENPVRFSWQMDPYLSAGIREYTERDPMNRMHWKASAHAGKLLVRQEERTAQQSVTVLLSLETNASDSGVFTRDNELMEHTIRVCAQCLWEFCRSGWLVRLCIGEIGEDGIPFETRRGGGAVMYHHMLELLAALPLKKIVPAAQLVWRKQLDAESVLLVAPCTDNMISTWKSKVNGSVIVTGRARDFGMCADLEICECI